MVDMSYSQLAGYPLSTVSTPATVSQMSSSVTSVTSPRACCENGRPIMTDPHTGQTICSCQYGTALLNYSRVQGLPEGVYGASAAAYAAAGATQGYVPLGSEGSAFYSPLTLNKQYCCEKQQKVGLISEKGYLIMGAPGFDIKEGSEAWRALAAQSGGCFPYDPSMALYPYGTGYGGLDLNARRKNATRETTNTLKAWLYEHRKNPYPTKGEKIMLAIITKMTLTQVSTWFANARRRLKKENKMTWSPRNRSEDDGSGDEDMDGKTNGHESDSSTLNVSIDDSHHGVIGSSERDHLDRIISVDEDESDQSDLGDLDDLDPCRDDPEKRDSDAAPKDNRLGEGSNSGETSKDGINNTNTSEESKMSRMNIVTARTSASQSETPTTRPKIWSVSDFLENKDSKDKKDNTSSKPSNSANSPAVVCSRQANGPAFLNIHQTNQNFRNGQFPVGFSGYPLSLSHTTLSYPYTLSSATAAKSELSIKHAAALRASEQAFKEGLVEKAARIQSRIFSPARELDGVRVGGKMVL